jgi:hypothetical protein
MAKRFGTHELRRLLQGVWKRKLRRAPLPEDVRVRLTAELPSAGFARCASTIWFWWTTGEKEGQDRQRSTSRATAGAPSAAVPLSLGASFVVRYGSMSNVASKLCMLSVTLVYIHLRFCHLQRGVHKVGK